MKFHISFLVKAILIAFVLVQTTLASDKGYRMMGNNEVADLLYLTLCGVGLLYLGFRKKAL